MPSAMFGIGFGEMVVIAVLILIAVGPDKLPTMIKTVAKTYRQFRRAALDIRASTGIDDLLRDEELRELAELRKQKLLAMSAKPAAKPAPKPGATAETAPAKAMGAHRPPDDGDEVPLAPTPYAKDAPGAHGLTYEQRTMEMPLEGVDVAEARHAIDVAAEPGAVAPALPQTREGVSTDAKTLPLKARGEA